MHTGTSEPDGTLGSGDAVHVALRPDAQTGHHRQPGLGCHFGGPLGLLDVFKVLHEHEKQRGDISSDSAFRKCFRLAFIAEMTDDEDVDAHFADDEVDVTGAEGVQLCLEQRLNARLALTAQIRRRLRHARRHERSLCRRCLRGHPVRQFARLCVQVAALHSFVSRKNGRCEVHVPVV